MTPDQLRAAAERLVHQWDNHDNYRRIAGEDNSEPVAVSLARAYLAEHSDQPAGGVASGCELPTGLGSGFWVRPKTKDFGEWAIVVRDEQVGGLYRVGNLWHVQGGVIGNLPRGNWHPAPASELAELRAEVERLRADAPDRDKAWQEKIATIVGNARKQVEALTTRAETAERERDEAREALATVVKRIEQTAAIAQGDAANDE